MKLQFAPTPEFWRSKRVFLTGHTGFKGAWLTLWLAHLGAKVCGYALPPDSVPSMYDAAQVGDACQSILADIRDKARLTQSLHDFAPDVVFHMAAQPFVRRSYREPVDTFEVNVQGTVNVLEACRGVVDLRAVVVVTTDKCYENHGQASPYREDESLGGYDPYSSSKACAELVTQAYRRSFFGGAGAALVASARAGNVIGGGDWGEDRIIPDAARAFPGNKPLTLRNPQSVRPWQHVTSPLLGYLMLARALWTGEGRFATAFNFGPTADRNRTVQDLVEVFVAAWDEGARWANAADPNAPHEAAVLMLDSTRARQMLGWRPNDDFSQWVQATAEWYRAHNRSASPQQLRNLTVQQIATLTMNALSAETEH